MIGYLRQKSEKRERRERERVGGGGKIGIGLRGGKQRGKMISPQTTITPFSGWGGG